MRRRFAALHESGIGTGRLSGNVRIDGEYRRVSGLTAGGLITAAHKSHLTSIAPVVLSVAYEVKPADDPKAPPPFKNSHESAAISHPCERSRILRIDKKDRLRTDGR